MNNPLLVALAGLFIVVLIARIWRGIAIGRRLRSSDASWSAEADPKLEALMNQAQDQNTVKSVLREIERRAFSRDSASTRAAYHCAAGHLALQQLKRPGLAVGFYLRALREDPTSIEALDKVQDILVAQKRTKRLEWTYWNVLSRLDDAEVGSRMWIRCWSGLASIYSASPKKTARADAIRKALTAHYSEEEVAANITSLTRIES